MLGIGLQGTLLGLRASLEGFPTTVTGLIMSAYFAGFLGGSLVAPKLVARVGHIRVFAALASLASIAALVHALFVEPLTWGMMRLGSGFCVAGLTVVAESWLNRSSNNETRGQLISVYMIVTLVGFAGGQLLLNVADPRAFELFVLVSILVSFALVPILLSVAPAPSLIAPVHVGLKKLYAISPLGVVGCLCTGMADGAFFGMGAVYAEALGLSVAQISYFMGLALLGGILLQWPIGFLSDAFDRRTVLAVVTFLTAGTAIAAVPLAMTSVTGLFVIVTLFGGLYLPMYSLCLAHTNDYLDAQQMVAASGGMVLVFGIGASLGPSLAAGAIALFGSNGFFGFLAAVHIAIGGFALYRMLKRTAKPLAEQDPTVPIPFSASPLSAILNRKYRIEEETTDAPDEREY